MDQKLFQISEIGLYTPIEINSEISGNCPFDGPVNLGWAHPELKRQATVGPWTFFQSHQLENYQDVLGFECHVIFDSRFTNKE